MNAVAAALDLPLTMDPTQVAYTIARAVYDAANAELVRRTAGMPTTTDAELDVWAEASEAAHQALGMDRLFEALGAAEDAMLAWSFEVARRTIRATKCGAVRTRDLAGVDALERACGLVGTQTQGVAIRYDIRVKSIDLALRLVP